MSAQTITSPAYPKQSGQPAASRVQKSRAASSRGSKSISVKESKPAPAAPVNVRLAPRKEIVFHFYAPSAGKVALAADFTDWDKAPVSLAKGRDGLWQTKIALSQGHHHYKFLVDGEWRDDPNCLIHLPNEFGTTNAVIEVT